MLGIQIVQDGHTHRSRKFLRAFSHNQMMVGLVHNITCYDRGSFYTLNRGYCAGATLRTMHTRGIQLHHTFGIRQPTVAHTVVQGIEFNNIDTCDQGIKHVASLCNQSKRLFDACNRSAVLEHVAVCRGDYDWFYAAAKDCRSFAKQGFRTVSDKSRQGGSLDELSTVKLYQWSSP